MNYNFLGFYIINTSVRGAFCSELGISISPFTAAFERLHVAELTKASELTSGATAQEKKVLTLLKPQFRKAVDEDMAEISFSQNIPVKDVCQIFSQQGEAFAQKMHISKVVPEVYATLMGSAH